MNLLTPTGYKDINDVNIGDELIAYDINTGVIIINTLLKKELWTNDMLAANPPQYNEEGELIYDGMTSEEVFQDTYGDWKFYEINGTWKLYKSQSVWANMKLVHSSDLQIGDIIYDDQDNDIIITSIVECVEPSWWRLTVSGDKSYIADNLQLHNASRYWQKQNASFNWNATGPTNWGSSSGVSDGASVPTSVDDVIFDGVGANGNINSTISANITILSLTFTSGYTATVTENATIVLTVAGNFTDNTAHSWTINSTATGALTISAASTITSNGKIFPGSATFSGGNTKVFIGDWTINGLFTSNPGTQTLNKTTNEVFYCNGYFNSNSTTTGTITIRIIGGNISTQFNTPIITVNEIILDGNITFGGVHYTYTWSVPNFKYVSGTISNANLVTLSPTSSVTYNWDLNPIIFGVINFSNTQNFNLISKLNATTISGSLNIILTFSGNFGFECSNFNFIIVNGNNITLKEGITYLVNSSFQLYAYGNYTTTTSALISSSLTNRAFLILKNGATNISNARFTRINATGGRTINTWNSTVTDCLNVRSFTDLQTVATSTIT